MAASDLPDGTPPELDEIHEVEPASPSQVGRETFIPTVEVAVLPRQGFGILKALLWCLYFLVVTQLLPGILVVVPFVAVEWNHIQERIQQQDAEAAENQKEIPIPKGIRFIATPEFESATLKSAPLGMVAGQICGVLFSLRYCRRVIGRDWTRKLAFRTPRVEHLVLVCLLVFPILVFNASYEMAVEWLVKKMGITGKLPLEKVGEMLASWPGWLIVLAGAVGPAMNEELFCRGFLGHSLVGRYGLRTGILLTSFLFGLIHLIPVQAIYAMLIGIVLHLTYVASRSIWVPILLHFLHNALVALAVSRDVSLFLYPSLIEALQFQPELMLFAATLLALSIGWAFSRTRVTVLLPNGAPAPSALYPHVQVPHQASMNEAVAGSMPAAVLLTVLVTAALFGAVWVGW